MATQKDYCLVAKAIKESREAIRRNGINNDFAEWELGLDLVVKKLCVEFEQDNPRFKADVFVAATEGK